MEKTLTKSKTKMKSMKGRRALVNSLIYILLIAISIIWIIPVVLIVMTAFRNESGMSSSFWPVNGWTWNNFVRLFTDKDILDYYPYVRWLGNTLLVAVCVMIISTIFVLSVAYTESKLKFKGRKALMSINLILGMFPGFISMVIVYNIFKVLKLDGQLFTLIIAYSASSGMGFLIAKGFFDTISKSLDEAARIDGASNAKIFFKITIPLSKPIIVYTLLTSFMGPWTDYIFARILVGGLGANRDNFTVAMGLYDLIGTTPNLAKYYTVFFAGAIIIAIPIMLLFLFTQKYYVEGVTGGAVKG